MNKFALGALSALLMVSGCGSAGSTPKSLDANDTVTAAYADDSVFYSTGSANFPTATSPAEVAVRQGSVVLGTVDGFEDGRSESFTYSDGTTEVDRFVVIRIRVGEVLKGDPESFRSGFAFLTRPRGIQTYDSKGNLIAGGDAAIPIERFSKWIPTGAKILVMASPTTTSSDKRIRVENPRAGVSDPQAPILGVYDPQTLLLDGGPESTLRGWQGDQKFTFDSALADVRAAVNRTS